MGPQRALGDGVLWVLRPPPTVLAVISVGGCSFQAHPAARLAAAVICTCKTASVFHGETEE